ncbi:hypothetical protein BHE74_00057807 [Ensete ventricosum]|nr:hypothetical protein GW17_00033169 [Ensete ventricosum]RWW37119.1 hypothetical protein BHE74_00057807 [Ensete ventricosum]
MAVISDIEEEARQQPSSSSWADADDEALASVLAKRGPMPFLEAAIDLVRRRTEFFKDEAATGEVVKAVTAAKEKFDAEEMLKKRAADEAQKNRHQEEVAAAAEAEEKKNLRKPNSGNGLDFDDYSWTQTLQDVTVNIPVPQGTRSKFVTCEIKKTHLKVGLKGQPLIIDVSIQIFDQQQKARGLPTSDEIQKQDMLKQFMAQISIALLCAAPRGRLFEDEASLRFHWACKQVCQETIVF